MLHSTFSRKGGQARSVAKTAANRAKAAAYWQEVRAGLRPAPLRRKPPPSSEEIARSLEPYCRNHGIVKLELFGSAARQNAVPGSDVDLIATFGTPPGIQFFAMAEEMSAILGVPVDLLTRETIDGMTNPIRREAILSDVRTILAF